MKKIERDAAFECLAKLRELADPDCKLGRDDLQVEIQRIVISLAAALNSSGDVVQLAAVRTAGCRP